MKEDWRLFGQIEYLKDAKLKYVKYAPFSEKWEHEHCQFCWQTIADYKREGIENYGYCTLDERYWICDTCFNDFKDMFNWELIK